MAQFFIFVFMVLVALHSPASALEGNWASADYVQARLLSGVSATGERMEIPAGLEIRLGEGWHAYWRMPGDGGLAPVFYWDGSENVEAVTVSWPAPERFEMAGLYSFGYEQHVTLPLQVKLEQPGKAAHLNLRGEIMVCKDICVPQKVQLGLDIPAGAGEPDPAMLLLEKAVEAVPHADNLPTLRIDSFVAGPDAIVVNAFSQGGYEDADLFIEAGDFYITALPEITLDKADPRKAMIRVAAPQGIDNLADYVGGREVVLTMVNGRQAIEKKIRFQD